jgi:hypothetical protein
VSFVRIRKDALSAASRPTGYVADVMGRAESHDGQYVYMRREVYDELRRLYSPPGLGDMVKSALSAVGITEERVSKAIGKPCGCGKRAAKLNEIGHKYLGLPPGQSPAG